MDYYSKLQETLDYIELNLKDNIVLSDISHIAGFSIYHFHRIFQAIIGYSLKEYIRKRRLTQGAFQLLCSDSSILEIALECQYNTHESFTRAFKKEFGINPNVFRKKNHLSNLFAKIDLSKYKTTKGALSMEPKIIQHKEFIVIGVELQTSITNNEGASLIPEFWQRYIEHKSADKIPNRLNTQQCYGICTNFDNKTGNFSYIIGEEVSTLDTIPEGYIGLTIPAAKYAIFTIKSDSHETMPNAIQKASHTIYGEWFPQAGYARANTPDFEFYDARMDKPQPEMDIYIPVL